jgi:8-oxo-dGTP pyrophosphatase MutT (NUDIX family)
VSTEDPTLSFITPRVAAGVLFTDDQDRVLMVVPSYKDYLDIPGGYVENGETPYQAAQREVYEELGIKPPIGRLLVADWWEDSPEANGYAKLLLVFDGGRLNHRQLNSLVVDEDEITACAFERPADLDNLTIPRLANRIRHALSARSNRRFLYLESGLPAPGQLPGQ